MDIHLWIRLASLTISLVGCIIGLYAMHRATVIEDRQRDIDRWLKAVENAKHDRRLPPPPPWGSDPGIGG